MTTSWSHLPNARYIDLVIASIKTCPDKWDHDIMPIEWIRAADTGRNVISNVSRNVIWSLTWSVAQSTIPGALSASAAGAIMALIAYDDCSHLLYSDLEEVELLAKLGVPAAILLFPACIVFNETKEINV